MSGHRRGFAAPRTVGHNEGVIGTVLQAMREPWNVSQTAYAPQDSHEFPEDYMDDEDRRGYHEEVDSEEEEESEEDAPTASNKEKVRLLFTFVGFCKFLCILLNFSLNFVIFCYIFLGFSKHLLL